MLYRHYTQYQVSLETISEALTHSDRSVTQVYVNSANNVAVLMGEIAFRSLEI
ncbi:phage integrase family recombinase [Ligilactobacillus equi DPC 6820]|uniref:Phage integrase family recombinase n=1 Tax=Ligilactobacillus equi DPC 6820 TaxID=1392007 RepID=V7HVG9_9LACO|nr:phage integrase family recombinase [Ligilactobacillus equi DPC 6820]